ncbi:histidine phosphatase family protein [Algoriphagus lutimaris]|uniref:SixA phosphatase family protein n=1 Tax=Algoriphagus lutimaris TaxID=613197 RepID=UPI00196A9B14|nr:histidine phosphatase family protein [Algoriphagus lutimaris]MBN3520294.1 histidine phosphatase family protein [Algoriphagus lutimaris]
MKKIILVRHGKSAWDKPFLADHKRPLAERGLRDVPVMAERLKARNIEPDLFLSSSATRALTTAELTAEVLGFPKKNIRADEHLYHASPEKILKIIHHQKDSHQTILLFGHNPGLNELIYLLGGKIDNLPTSGQFGFTFDTDEWEKISKKNAKVWFVDYPKRKVN